MSETHTPPTLVQAFLLIHKVISRGLIVSVEKGEYFIQAGFPNTDTHTGYALYVQSLAIVLDAHHLSEDEVAFPLLKEKIAEAPYEHLARHHQEIVALLGAVREVIPLLEARRGQADLAALVDGLRKISDIWRPHIQIEEFYFSEEALAAAMSPEEQVQASAAISRHSQEHATPAPLALPFLLFNLEVEDRAAMAASLPKQIVEELIPKTWKLQWAPMKAFLLE
jgi:hypothetical protein